jgi:Protein of unknown function (DUF2490)
VANTKIISKNSFFSLLLYFLFTCTIALAQPKSLGCWLNYTNQIQFSKKLGLNIDYQYRNYTFIHNYEQSIVRGAIYYRLEKQQIQFSAGVAYANTSRYLPSRDAKQNIDENRIHQQILIGNKFGRIYINHRYRLEERFFKKQDLIRFRYNLNLQIPFNKNEIEPGAVYLSLTNEIFLHNKIPHFDRYRIIGEIGYYISPSFRVESGLLWQILESNNRAQIRFSVLQTIRFF